MLERLERLFTPRLRAVLIAVLLYLAVSLFSSVANTHYPITKWLVWRYLGYAAGSLYVAAACLSVGRLVVVRLLPEARWLERVTLSFAVGLYLFELGLFLLGLARAYHPVTFFVYPGVLFALGARPLLEELRRVVRHGQIFARGRPAWTWLLVGFGALALVFIYATIMTPDNVQYDARWRHLAIAEDYVASGGVRRFPEGWTPGAAPHFTSILYAWAFMLPFGRSFDFVVLSAHLELMIFLVTTFFGITAVARRLAPSADPRVVWVARFLFPGVLLYDSSLSAGADHVGASFGPPLFLALFWCTRGLTPKRLSLLALLLAAVVMTKETSAVLLSAGPMLVVLVMLCITTVRALRGRGSMRSAWLGILAAIVVGLACSAPHWLKNWIWYGDPLYPMLAGVMSPRPWIEDGAYYYRHAFINRQLWAPQVRGVEAVIDTAKVLFTFSFVPHDWPNLHRNVPVFGSLFTLLTVCLPFLKNVRRIWLLWGWILLGIGSWYWINHQDRYLQAYAPLMAAVVAAMIVHIWRLNTIPARVGLAFVVGFQVLWGGDVVFFQTHRMIHMSPLRKTIELLEAGHHQKYDERFEWIGSNFAALGDSTPPKSLIVMHEFEERVGLGRGIITDIPAYQFAIDYGQLRTAPAVWQRYRDLGATHVVWRRESSMGLDSLAGDLVFFDFAMNHTDKVFDGGEARVAALRPEPPPPNPSEEVLVISCKPPLDTGVYTLESLSVPVHGPRKKYYRPPEEFLNTPVELEHAANRARYVITENGCNTPPPAIKKRFQRATTRPHDPDDINFQLLNLWVLR